MGAPLELPAAETSEPLMVLAGVTDKPRPSPRPTSHVVKEPSMTRSGACAEGSTSPLRIPCICLASMSNRSRRSAAIHLWIVRHDLVVFFAARCSTLALQRNRPFAYGVENDESSSHEGLPQ
jgi:hypothetical protein